MELAFRLAAGLGFWLSTSVTGAALAQSANLPDKSQYWLFDPVPDDQMRDFSTDRPPKAYVPFTVDAGHFQYETDIVNFADQANGPTRTNTLLAPNPTLKFGLTNNTDLEVNMPIVGVATLNSSSTGYPFNGTATLNAVFSSETITGAITNTRIRQTTRK